MDRILASSLALLVLAAGSCGGGGGNLLPRADLSGARDVADNGRDAYGADIDRDIQAFDPGDEDAPPPSDEGSDPGVADPGTDPGTPPPPVRLVTDQAALSTIVNLVDNAASSLQVVELEFVTGWAPDQVGAALARAAARGVQVRVLMESDVADNATRADALASAGIDARLDGASKTLHTKLVVADRTRALVGSTNLSISSLNYNHEANLALEGGALVEPFAAYADALWANPGKAASIPTASTSNLTPIGDGQYVARVLPHIAAASRRALLVMYDLTNDWSGDIGDAAQALIDARQRGLDVRVVLESTAYETYVNDDNKASGPRLAAAGVQVRYNAVQTLTHAKMLVTDDEVTVYSGNWVYTSFSSNHEAGALVSASDVAADATAYFEKVWAESTP